MKKVGVTQRVDFIKEYGEVSNTLDIKWGELLESIDILAIPLSININISLIDELNLDGIILTGGNDLSSQSKNDYSTLRDKHEYDCIKYALRNSLPVFGVCRGMQIIAEYFGSTFRKVQNHVGNRHKIKIIDKMDFSSNLKNIEIVNSFHNYAINILGSDLQPIAICPDDNTVEAIKHRDHRIFGQMWHPEREKPFNRSNIKLIHEFFNAKES